MCHQNINIFHQFWRSIVFWIKGPFISGWPTVSRCPNAPEKLVPHNPQRWRPIDATAQQKRARKFSNYRAHTLDHARSSSACLWQHTWSQLCFGSNKTRKVGVQFKPEFRVLRNGRPRQLFLVCSVCKVCWSRQLGVSSAGVLLRQQFKKHPTKTVKEGRCVGPHSKLVISWFTFCVSY